MRTSQCLLLAGVLLASSQAQGQSVTDPSLVVQTVVTGLDTPTTMAFIGVDDFLVLQKNDGRVRRVIGGVLQPGDVLDLTVDNTLDKGLLGIVLDPDFVNDRYVFLYYSEAVVEGSPAIANRVYRYTWDGAQLVDPHLVLDLPNIQTFNIGGILVFGHDDELYMVMGDLQRTGKLQNVATHADPDDTSVLFRVHPDGTAVVDNPFIDLTGTLAPMQRYYAYGVRNSFGMAVDPVTGAIWDTENGQVAYDEINRVDPGFNSGWVRIQGPVARNTPNQDSLLWVAPGSHYSDPEFSWKLQVAPTAMMFVENPKLGCSRVHDLLVGDTNCGNLHHFVPNLARDGFSFVSPELQDLVADNDADACSAEQAEIGFGAGFGVLTDIKTGPDGNVYLVELVTGSVYRIVPAIPPAQDADGDGVDDACDCNAADAGSWSPTVEVPRLRLSRIPTTSLGWDAQRAATGPGVSYSVVTGTLSSLHSGGGFTTACTLGTALAENRLVDSRPAPAPGEGYFYLVRASNGCGAGTFGDASAQPDPRDLLDASLPAACVGTLSHRSSR